MRKIKLIWIVAILLVCIGFGEFITRIVLKEDFKKSLSPYNMKLNSMGYRDNIRKNI